MLPRTTGWVRVGFADSRAQAVARYVGLGAVQSGTFANRPDDRLGIAIAHAIIGSPTVQMLGLSSAETSLEASYQVKLSDRFAIQPDVQYIIHPAGISRAPNSLGLGLRLVVTAGFPKKPVATDSSDPTVPPDGAPTTAPADAPQTPSTPGN
jgi:porin